jgi:hypothetical protein
LSLLLCAPLGFIAWFMGSSAREQVRAGYYRESGMLTAGYVMGIVGALLFLVPLAIIALVLLAIVLIAALAATA